jgi:hypothetical protein
MLVLAPIGFVLTGCGQIPGPTPLEPAADTRVEVAYENHSDDVFVVSILGAAPDQQGFATVDPCSANVMSVAAEPPFEIRFGQDQDDRAPQPVIATSLDFPGPDDGVYRYFIRVQADGVVQAGLEIAPALGEGAVC